MYRYMIRTVLFHPYRRAARQQPRSIQNLANSGGSDNCSLDLRTPHNDSTAAVTTVTTT